MSQLQDRIAQFRKMANDDPDNELGHYRLGQLLMEDKQNAEAINSFRRTLELSPQFSKVYHLLALSLLNENQRAEALEVLRKGYAVADERGDNMPALDVASGGIEHAVIEHLSVKRRKSCLEILSRQPLKCVSALQKKAAALIFKIARLHRPAAKE